MAAYRKVTGGNVGDGNVVEVQSQEALIVADSHRSQMSGRLMDIWTAFTIVTIPMLAFSGVLLSLVHSYRVTHTAHIDGRLQSPATIDEPGVYYVNLSATVLIFISSWSSSLGPMLLSFLMTLASYPLARQYWLDIREQKPTLPTPFQFALSLRFISGGGWGALYNWMKYLVSWRKQRQFQSALLTESAFATVVITTLSLIVFLADTWLHITTSTVLFVNVTPVTAVANYSLNLIPGCLESNNSAIAKPANCSYFPSATARFLFNPTQALTVLNNVSNSITVYNNGPDPTYTYLGVPASETAGYDFTATTFGMRTQCKPASRQCNLIPTSGAATLFQCSSAFYGNLQAQTWQPAYFADSAMESNDTYYGVQNPYYHAIGAGFQTANNPNLSLSSHELVTPIHGGISFVLSCSIEMYDVEYDSINGTVTRFVATPSNISVANAWQVPIEQLGVAEANLQTAALIAVTTATTAQGLADQYALAYSKAALGLGAQSVELAPALAVNERSSLLVTRIPMAPLFALIAANLAFVVLGITLTYSALATSGGSVRDIQARLSIFGLVADRFERSRMSDPVRNVDELFTEYSGGSSSAVALEKTPSGGFAYREWKKIID